jgi:hypothetical protein
VAPHSWGRAILCLIGRAHNIWTKVGANPLAPVEHGAAPLIPWRRGVSLGGGYYGTASGRAKAIAEQEKQRSLSSTLVGLARCTSLNGLS